MGGFDALQTRIECSRDLISGFTPQIVLRQVVLREDQLQGFVPETTRAAPDIDSKACDVAAAKSGVPRMLLFETLDFFLWYKRVFVVGIE